MAIIKENLNVFVDILLLPVRYPLHHISAYICTMYEKPPKTVAPKKGFVQKPIFLRNDTF